MKFFKKTLDLLTFAQKKSAIYLITLMIISMFLEVLGIGLIIPALGMMIDPNVLYKYSFLAPILKFFGEPTNIELILGAMIFIACVYSLKIVFLTYFSWKKSFYTQELSANVSQRLFKGYLRQPYAFYLQRNSSQLIRNITTESEAFSGVILAVLDLMSENLVFIGIITLLIFVEPIGTIVVLITLGICGFIFYYFSKNSILRWGEMRQFHDGNRIQHIQQGIGGLKDVKLLGREKFFINNFDYHNHGLASMRMKQDFLQAIPRLWLELLAVYGLALLVLTILFQGKPTESLIPILGLFAGTSFRLLPSTNRIINRIQTVRYTIPVVNVLFEEFSIIRKNFDVKNENLLQKKSFKRTLELKNVSYIYKGTSLPSLVDVSIKISRGESVGFIGKSGAGKSTLINLILGLLTPNNGSVLVDDDNIQSNIRSWQNQVGYVPQSIYLTDDTLRKNIAFGLDESEIDESALKTAIKTSQLDQYFSSLPNGADTYVGERGIRLSGGQLQRIGIARALYHKPEVLVLDEATSSLDNETEKELMMEVNSLKNSKTIIIVSHRLSTVSQCDRIYSMSKGKIINEGVYEEVVNV